MDKVDSIEHENEVTGEQEEVTSEPKTEVVEEVIEEAVEQAAEFKPQPIQTDDIQTEESSVTEETESEVTEVPSIEREVEKPVILDPTDPWANEEAAVEKETSTSTEADLESVDSDEQIEVVENVPNEEETLEDPSTSEVTDEKPDEVDDAIDEEVSDDNS